MLANHAKTLGPQLFSQWQGEHSKRSPCDACSSICYSVTRKESWTLQDLELLKAASGEDGVPLPDMRQGDHEELIAAHKRFEESSAEVQRLTAIAASCRQEVCRRQTQ